MQKNYRIFRVVVARELSKKQIRKFVNLDLKLAFVHGALCMSISGQCYMSAMMSSRSANRGLCAQTYRLPFSATDNPQACALSLKSLSLFYNYLDEMRVISGTSFKIEGRMKRPEYVCISCNCLL